MIDELAERRAHLAAERERLARLTVTYCGQCGRKLLSGPDKPFATARLEHALADGCLIMGQGGAGYAHPETGPIDWGAFVDDDDDSPPPRKRGA